MGTNSGMAGKSKFPVVCLEKDMQVMIVTTALLSQENDTVAQCTYVLVQLVSAHIASRHYTIITI